jgi:hypothetical protein
LAGFRLSINGRFSDVHRGSYDSTGRRRGGASSLKATRPLKIMARVMGHTKADTTINTYAQVLEESVRAAVAPVDEKLFKVVQSRTRASALIH